MLCKVLRRPLCIGGMNVGYALHQGISGKAGHW